MPIRLTPNLSEECNFAEWSIPEANRDRLVEVLAFLYLRQEKNALRVIGELEPRPRVPPGKVAQNVVRKLTAPNQVDNDLARSGDDQQKRAAKNRIETSIWHRDGLLFQHLSWIVARMSIPNGYMTSPHVRQADKGFDGFIIEFDDGHKQIRRVILCEDKASERPRTLVKSSVWKEIEAILHGERDDETLADLTTLLKSVPGIDAESVVDEIFWESAREFRVSIATGENRRKTGSFIHIVKGLRMWPSERLKAE